MSEGKIVPSPAPPSARPPNHRALPGACDTHFHIFESPAKYSLSPQRIYDPPLSSVAGYRAMASMLGIERMVVVQASAYGTDNHCLLDSIPALGARNTRGIAVVAVGGEITTLGGEAAGCGNIPTPEVHAGIVGIATATAHCGQVMAGADGGVFALGVPFLGSAARIPLASPVIGIAS